MNGQTITLIGAFVMFLAAFLFGLYIFCDMWMLRQRRWDVVDWQVKLTDMVLLCIFVLVLFLIPAIFGYIWHYVVSQ
jgi:hypothetical protein